MQKISLEALARQQMKLAATAAGRHTADTVYGGHEKVLRQTVIGMMSMTTTCMAPRPLARNTPR